MYFQSKYLAWFCYMLIISITLCAGCNNTHTICSEHIMMSGETAATKLRNNLIQDFQLVIGYLEINEPDRECYISAFQKVYIEYNEADTGRQYAELIRESVKGGHYKAAYELGQEHVAGNIIDATVQKRIRSSVGLSGSITLGWKTGYINGHAQGTIKAMSYSAPEDIEKAYVKAKAMYDALRASAGFK